jgi:hypothetical protein
MKMKYEAPNIYILQMNSCTYILGGSDGRSVYTDDPQKPGNALSRRHNFWEEDDEDWE